MTQWFAIYEAGTGRLVSQATVLASPEELEERGLEVKPIRAQNPDGKVWNPKTLDFDIDVPIPVDTRAELDQLVARIEAASTIEEAKVAAAEVKGKLDDVAVPGDVIDVGGQL